MTDDQFTVIMARLDRIEHRINDEKPEGIRIGGIDLASEVTGYAKQTIYQKVSSKTIPFHKHSKKIVFNEHELREWMLHGMTNKEMDGIEKVGKKILKKVGRKSRLQMMGIS